MYMRMSTAGLLVLIAMAIGPAKAASQSLPLKDEPEPASILCTTGASEEAGTDAGRAEAERLVNAATQALILGDLSVAAEFLEQALEADPQAAEASYLLGRVTYESGEVAEAVPWFCRYLALAPSGPSAPEARRRLASALERGIGTDLLATFTAGVSSFHTGRLDEAEQLFTAVLDQQAVPEALYNRGVILVGLERALEAREDLVRYLELRPNASDRAAVDEALQLLSEEYRRPSAAAAFFLGAIVPGGGQFYTGRPGFGLLTLSLASGAAAAGYLYEETSVLCRAQPVDGGCPPDQVVSEETERPYLLPGLGAAGALMLVAAIEAALEAASVPELEVPLGGGTSLGLGPAVGPTGSPLALDLSLLRLRY